MDQPTYDQLLEDVQTVRNSGLPKLRNLDVPYLRAAASAHFGPDMDSSAAVELLLSEAVGRLGGGAYGNAAQCLFGFVQGTRSASAAERLREAAGSKDTTENTFRRRHLQPMVKDIANQLVMILAQHVRDAASFEDTTPTMSIELHTLSIVPDYTVTFEGPHAEEWRLQARRAWAGSEPVPELHVEVSGSNADRLLFEDRFLFQFGRTSAVVLREVAQLAAQHYGYEWIPDAPAVANVVRNVLRSSWKREIKPAATVYASFARKTMNFQLRLNEQELETFIESEGRGPIRMGWDSYVIFGGDEFVVSKGIPGIIARWSEGHKEDEDTLRFFEPGNWLVIYD